ncbi:MAG: redoxin domain-containing protein [Sandaracinaceae bacterium]
MRRRSVHRPTLASGDARHRSRSPPRPEARRAPLSAWPTTSASARSRSSSGRAGARPCQQELPFYEQLYQRYRERGFRVVAISTDSQGTVMRAGPTARRLGLTYDVVTDLDTRVTTQLNPRRTAPFNLGVDEPGQLVREREVLRRTEARSPRHRATRGWRQLTDAARPSCMLPS